MRYPAMLFWGSAGFGCKVQAVPKKPHSFAMNARGAGGDARIEANLGCSFGRHGY